MQQAKNMEHLITKEKLEVFIHQVLKYRDTVHIRDYSSLPNGKYINLSLSTALGEIVEKQRFYEWIDKSRIEKIEEFLKK
jgi:hypothetical protein